MTTPTTEAAMTETLLTNNMEHGFWGTIRHDADPAEAWPLAMRTIAAATGCAEEAVRDFLDSKHGRHFADEVANYLFAGLALSAAIDAAVARWAERNTGRHLEREYGIPRGTPYLAGLVIHFEIERELDA